MLPINNRRVTAEEALEQCRTSRQQARILEKRDRPYEIDSPSFPSSISAPASTPPKSKADSTPAI